MKTATPAKAAVPMLLYKTQHTITVFKTAIQRSFKKNTTVSNVSTSLVIRVTILPIEIPPKCVGLSFNAFL